MGGAGHVSNARGCFTGGRQGHIAVRLFAWFHAEFALTDGGT